MPDSSLSGSVATQMMSADEVDGDVKDYGGGMRRNRDAAERD
jgi:hypothetical protein